MSERAINVFRTSDDQLIIERICCNAVPLIQIAFRRANSGHVDPG